MASSKVWPHWDNPRLVLTGLRTWEIKYKKICSISYVVIYSQLEKLIRGVQELPLGLQEEALQHRLLSKCALFVFNKWDQIKLNNRETFRNRVTKKLQKLSPGIDPESQMIYVSATDAALAQNCGCFNEGLSSLVNHMKILVEKSIETRLEIHWRYTFIFCSVLCF